MTQRITVKRETRGAFCVLQIDNPPLNGLMAQVWHDLNVALAAERGGGCRGIVLTGAEKFFSGGADIGEFDDGLDPAVADPNAIHAAIEDAGIPVITRRSSTRGTPCDRGKYGAIRRICASERRNRPLMATPPDATIESIDNTYRNKFNGS